MNSISEFDNGLDDLDDCWDDRSIDSDESIDYSPPAAKKAKASLVTVAKAVPTKKNVKVASGVLKPNLKVTVKDETKLKVKAKTSKLAPVESVKQATAATNTTKTAESEKVENSGEASFPLEQFDLTESTVLLLKERGIESLFPIQAETFWPIKAGKDLIGRARTGQGID